ncbi:hypothetical protein BGX30_004561 [Mortierella sp. GBA39]|nr:hypothetical protein BGX30_004561 [Mortierella sp. GBA39]
MYSFVCTGFIAVAVCCIVAGPRFVFASPPLFNHYQEIHSLAKIPNNWEELQLAPSDELLHLRIGLKQQNVNAFHQKVYDISTPGRPSYGIHMSQAEIDDMLRPADDSSRLVLEWLRSHGVQGMLDNHWVKAKVTVSQANKLLQTQYRTYRNTVSGNQVIRTTAYHLPTIFADHVDVILPTTMFPIALRTNVAMMNRKPHVADPSCRHNTTISCLQQLYRIPKPTGTPNKNVRFGVAGFDGEFANNQDLQSFLGEQQPAVLNKTFTFISVNGGLNSQNLSEAGAEANLDVQYAIGLAPDYETRFYSVLGTPPFIPSANTPTNTDEPSEVLMEFLLKSQELPHTLSISYGSEEQTVPRNYAQRVCNGFAILGARGTSVIVSSGDQGVGDNNPDPAAQQCFTNDGKNQTKFLAVFPASCPFVTSVGATTGFHPEVAVSNFGSGGGFSWYFKRPPYQKRAVDAYLALLPKGLYKGLYRPTGRAYPDVAAQGYHYRIWLGGKPVSVSGTSASTPTFAAVITHLNAERLSQGKKPLGFLNPWLYGKGKAALNDVVWGSNPGCGTQGFSAARGWDPVTGLGTPDFVNMLALLPHK